MGGRRCNLRLGVILLGCALFFANADAMAGSATRNGGKKTVGETQKVGWWARRKERRAEKKAEKESEKKAKDTTAKTKKGKSRSK